MYSDSYFLAHNQDEKEKAIRKQLVTLIEESGFLPVAENDAQFWEKNLFEQGILDSMAIVYWTELLHKEFSVELDMHMLVTELNTLEAIAQYIASKIKH